MSRPGPRSCDSHTRLGHAAGAGPSLSLEPFPGAKFPAGLEIRCAVGGCANLLAVTWELAGNRAEVAIPPPAPAPAPARKVDLWKDTCFELFLARPDSQQYWEFNLSPSGDWNVYRFDAYRRGMREEEAFSSLPSKTDREDGFRSISLEIDFEKIIPATEAPACRAGRLDAAISAVIRGPDKEISWWALVHCGPKPDFHRRDSFVIRI